MQVQSLRASSHPSVSIIIIPIRILVGSWRDTPIHQGWPLQKGVIGVKGSNILRKMRYIAVDFKNREITSISNFVRLPYDSSYSAIACRFFEYFLQTKQNSERMLTNEKNQREGGKEWRRRCRLLDMLRIKV